MVEVHAGDYPYFSEESNDTIDDVYRVFVKWKGLSYEDCAAKISLYTFDRARSPSYDGVRAFGSHLG